jgi:hypothetical protein
MNMPITNEGLAILACGRSLLAESDGSVNNDIVRSMVHDACVSLGLDSAERDRIEDTLFFVDAETHF